MSPSGVTLAQSYASSPGGSPYPVTGSRWMWDILTGTSLKGHRAPELCAGLAEALAANAPQSSSLDSLTGAEPQSTPETLLRRSARRCTRSRTHTPSRNGHGEETVAAERRQNVLPRASTPLLSCTLPPSSLFFWTARVLPEPGISACSSCHLVHKWVEEILGGAGRFGGFYQIVM